VDDEREPDSELEPRPARGNVGDPEPGGDEPFERPVDRFRKGAVGSVMAAGLLGIADALEARPPKEEVVIVSEVPSAPPRDPRRLELLLDPEHPERSLVFLPEPAEHDEADPRAPDLREPGGPTT
jgi:hypothetical protein